eukprot:14115894-Heterocapsa_arctica.AAC.1
MRPFNVSAQPDPKVVLDVARYNVLREAGVEVVEDNARHAGREQQVAGPIRGALMLVGFDELSDRIDHLKRRPATSVRDHGVLPLVLDDVARALQQPGELALLVGAVCHATRIPNDAGHERAFGGSFIEGRVNAQ